MAKKTKKKRKVPPGYMAKKTKKKRKVPRGYRRLGGNVSEKVHKKLKMAAVMKDATVGEIIEELVKKHL